MGGGLCAFLKGFARTAEVSGQVSMSPLLRAAATAGFCVLVGCRDAPRAVPTAAHDAGRPDLAPPAVRGGGATLPLLMVEAWTRAFASTTGKRVDYRPTGSGEGVRALLAGEIDFALSDVRLTAAELSAAGATILQVPVTSTALAVVHNLPGHKAALRLDAELLAAIYLGEITRWNDPRLLALNPELPDLAIVPVRRAESSGSTAVLCRYLAQVPRWADRVGVTKRLDLAAGVRAPGTLGVIATVRTVKGSLGYAAIAAAIEAQLGVTELRNATDRFVGPTTAAVGWAAQELAPDGREPVFDLLVARGEHAYPLATYSFALVRIETGREATVEFLTWALIEGQALAPSLSFVPLVPTVSDWSRLELRRMPRP